MTPKKEENFFAPEEKKPTNVSTEVKFETPIDNVPDNVLMIPRITLTQPNSPEVLSQQFRPGQLINSLTKEEIKSPIIMPMTAQMQYIRFNPINEGGGIVYRTKDSQDPRVIQDTKWEGEEKPLCNAYIDFVCFVDGEDMPIVASFSRSSFNTGRKIYTLYKLSNQPLFFKKYKLVVRQKTKPVPHFVIEAESSGVSTPEERAKASEFLSYFKPENVSFDTEQPLE